jgi:uncharacterized protein YndB with AHSA1/START domain
VVRGYEIDQSVVFPRPVERVYAFLADIQDAEPFPRRAQVTMRKEPAGMTRAGTRWHERVRLVPGFWLAIESTVVEADAPHRLVLDFTSRWWSGRLTYEMTPVADGSLLRHHERIEPRAPLRPFTPWIGRRLDGTIAERLADIKEQLAGSGH